jgi:ribonuclease P protein component
LLFAKGRGKSKAPLKLMYLASESDVQDVKAMFVVPKKKFKKAHDRNKLRRRIKEAYRLQKNAFYKELGDVHLNLAFIYTSNEAHDHSSITAAVHQLLGFLSKQIASKSKTT